MVLIISDDRALAENLGEILHLAGLHDIRLRNEYKLQPHDEEKGLDLIVYCRSSDPTGEQFEWYLIANDMQSIPVIFLTLKSRKNNNRNHIHLELPLDLTAFDEAISDCLAFDD